MSLINQALKLEQQKRHTYQGPVAPMVSRAARRGHNDKLPLLLFGFTGMGMLLAASVTAIFYFGSDFLDSEKTLATAMTPEQASLATPSAPQVAASHQTTTPDAPRIEELLSTLSQDQLSTVQRMLLEREANQGDAPSMAIALEDSQEQEEQTETNLSEMSRLQSIVDTFSVQGIRKSGQDTRVFLNGKIRRIGDVVDIENSIQLIGFTETALVFSNPDGTRFEKAL